MTLIIENADKKMAQIIKSVAEIGNLKVQIKNEKNDSILQAIKEIERGEYTDYKTFADFKKEMKCTS